MTLVSMFFFAFFLVQFVYYWFICQKTHYYCIAIDFLFFNFCEWYWFNSIVIMIEWIKSNAFFHINSQFFISKSHSIKIFYTWQKLYFIYYYILTISNLDKYRCIQMCRHNVYVHRTHITFSHYILKPWWWW